MYFRDYLRTRQHEASCGLTGGPVTPIYIYLVNEMIATKRCFSSSRARIANRYGRLYYDGGTITKEFPITRAVIVTYERIVRDNPLRVLFFRTDAEKEPH